MSKLINKIKKEIKNENFDIVIKYIKEIQDEITFRELKEQKIINQISDKGEIKLIYDTYLECASKIKNINLVKEMLYLDFIIITSNIKNRNSNVIYNQISNLKKYNKISCLQDILCWLEHKEEEIIKQSKVEFNNEKTEINKRNVESCIHQLNARVIELLNVGARVITNIVNNLDEDGFNFVLKYNEIENLFGAHGIYQINEYIIDKVAYGELTPSEVDFESYMCKFDYSDYELIKVRYGQIRRNISSQILKAEHKSSIVRDTFEEFAVQFITDFLQIYKENYGCKFCTRESEIINELKVRINEFTDDDDLILLSYGSNKKVIALYSLALALLSISIIEYNITYVAEPSIRERVLFYVPFEWIIDYIKEMYNISIDNEMLLLFCIDNKVKNSREILKKPFLLTESNLLFGFKMYTRSFEWLGNIRNNFIKGDKISNVIGSRWESIIGDIVESFNWNILGEGVILRENGKTITDIDLLAERDGIILLIQAKGIGNSTSPYELWKAKNTVKDGINQAIISMEFISKNDKFIINLLNSNKIKVDTVKKIIPIVVTPNIKFSGWQDKNISVVSVGDLIIMLQAMEYHDNLEEKYLVINNYSNNILDISKISITYEKINLSGFNFFIPDLDFK